MDAVADPDIDLAAEVSPGGLLCHNTGSSSLKAAGYALRGGRATAVFRAGHDSHAGAAWLADGQGARQPIVPPPPDRAALVRVLLATAQARLPGPLVVAHRIVQGAGTVEEVTPALIATLEQLTPLAPLHQPAGLDPVRTIAAAAPGLRQLAVFDSAFHRTIPDLARTLPLPDGVRLRRRGFHGLSYAHVARRMAAVEPRARRVVALHLGGGASLCAMRDGESRDTTMGATPLDGAMMATRCGALDPGAVLALVRERGLEATERLLWQESGLKGVSGISGDLRDLLGSDDPAAERAVALYCRSLARELAVMVAALDGLDAVVFTGGAGAGQPALRARLAPDLSRFGLRLDAAANAAADGGAEAQIAAPGSAVNGWVIPPDEEAEMVRAACPQLG